MSETTYSIADTRVATEYVTLGSILDTYHQFKKEHLRIVKELKTAPDIFKKLNRHFEDEQAKLAGEGVKTLPPEQVWLSNLWGMSVVVDPHMKPGTWKFVEAKL